MVENKHMDNRRILHSVKWNYFGAMIRMVSQLGVSAVLARLLTPDDFGLIALGTVIIRFAKYFSDLGMGGAIVQKKEISDQDIGASFFLSVVLGLIFCTLLVMTAAPIARFYENPGIEIVIQWLAAGFLISGLSTTALALLRRSMHFKYLAMAETLSYLFGYGIVGIGMAYTGFGVYSLIAAFLSQSGMLMILAYSRSRHTLVMPVEKKYYMALAAFGGKYSVANFLSFLASNIDHLIIGKYFSPAALGLYNRGKYIVSLPTYQMLTSVTSVLFPAYASHQGDMARMRELYMNGMLLTGMILLPISIGMIPAAETLVMILLGDQWGDSVVILQICSLFIPIDLMTSVGATLCSATNHIRSQIKIQVIILVFMVAGMAMAAQSGQIEMIAAVMVVAYWVRFFMYNHIVRKIIGTQWSDHLHLHLPHISASISVAVPIYVVTSLLEGWPLGIMLAGQVLTGVLSLGMFIIYGPFKNVRSVIYQMLNNSKFGTSSNRFSLWLLASMNRDARR